MAQRSLIRVAPLIQPGAATLDVHIHLMEQISDQHSGIHGGL